MLGSVETGARLTLAFADPRLGAHVDPFHVFAVSHKDQKCQQHAQQETGGSTKEEHEKGTRSRRDQGSDRTHTPDGGTNKPGETAGNANGPGIGQHKAEEGGNAFPPP